MRDIIHSTRLSASWYILFFHHDDRKESVMRKQELKDLISSYFKTDVKIMELSRSYTIAFDNGEGRKFVFVIYVNKQKWCVYTKKAGKKYWRKVPFCEIFDIFYSSFEDFKYPPLAIEICKLAEVDFFDYAC